MRLVKAADYPVSELTNSTQRQLWVESQVQAVKESFMDGVNVDIEQAINSTQLIERKLLTILMKEVIIYYGHE